MYKLKTFFQTKPVFLYLLPVFFVLHGFTDNYALVPVKDALLLVIQYLGISVLLALAFWLLYRNFHKANLTAFFIMAFNFFFGSVHDFLKANFNTTLITRFSFIIPATLIILFVLIIYIKKSKNSFSGIAKYLNVLFIVLLLLDAGNLLIKSTKAGVPRVVNFPAKPISCDTCSKPDVYLIVADEYAGKTELKDIFSYDNTAFENDLSNRGFHILHNTKSNYNWTIYSMASLLNMSYNENLRSNIINNEDMFLCADRIETNNISKFFKQIGYQIYNYSFFDLADNPKPITPVFLPKRKALITAQTFTNRVNKALWFNFASQEKIQNILNHNLYNNLEIDSLLRENIKEKKIAPKFVYTHLLMPHYPYYFDSSGKRTKTQGMMDENKVDKKAYIEYLVHCNKKLLELADYIKTNSTHPPIIIFMSDHGFRQFESSEKVDSLYQFMNINAVFMPDGNYSGFMMACQMLISSGLF